MMKHRIVICLAVFAAILSLSACYVSAPIPPANAPKPDMSGFYTVALGDVSFTKENAKHGEARIFAQKIKTELYKRKLGERYVTTPDRDTLVITAHISDFEHGQGNLKILFGVIGRSKLYGDITLRDYTGKPIYEMGANATSLPTGGFIAGYTDGDYLMDLIAADIAGKVATLLGVEQ